ncbi:MAG: hypothetical protein IKH02_00745, partial [Prevotella sp.]|nr:hypothetical protein [Prevotella sp.]
EDFCELMKGQEGFQRVDAAQILLGKMEEDVWNNLFDEAQGILRDNFRKTFIMRWNTDISNYKLCEFEEAMDDFADDFSTTNGASGTTRKFIGVTSST